ncbi:MAG: TraR/DksA C4-type zinc finger protein [Nitrospirota bacterium]|nr:TraR/DksA C4-type zinc finger protein [Nitrospirota bacterium]
MDSAHFKQRLVTLRAELLEVEESGNEAARTVELDQSKVGRLSRMDALQSQAIAKEAQQRRSIQKQRIDSALSRLENGNYGLCVRCEEGIDPKRLEFDPSVPLCFDCASKRET